jgi:subtilisin family serine protease
VPQIRTLSRLLAVPLFVTAVVSLPGSSSASSGDEQPVKVVVTSRAADGTPVISTVVADTRSKARAIIDRALARRGTIGAELDHWVSIAATYNDTYRSKQWALTALKAETVSASTKGSGVTVAVVDTGVRSSHADLQGNVLSGTDIINPGTSADDDNGHGTHVAGIIAAIADNKKGVAGLAPKVKILPVDVLDRNGVGSSANVAKGILYATSHGAKVINLSLGSSQSSTAIASAVADAIKKNVLVVASAGNSGCGLLGGRAEYPAAYPGVVGVGSVNSSLRRSSFSSCGSWVDVVAPGEGIISTMIHSSVGLGCASSADYCTLSGTSMASPYVAAAGALAISKRGWGQSTVASRLASTAKDLGTAGKDKYYGSGFIDPVKLISQ